MSEFTIHLIFSIYIFYIVFLILANFRVLARSKHIEFILMLLASFFANIGYYWLAFADDLSEALMSQKLVYIFSMSMMYFLFLIILQMCNFSIPKWIKYGLGAITAFSILPVMTIGKTQLFYKTVEFEKIGAFGVMTKTYGPAHSLTTGIIFFYMIATLLVALYSITRPKISSRRHAIILSITEAVSVFDYFFQKVLPIHFDLMPFGHCITMTVALLVLKKVYLYDATRAEQKIREDYHDGGVLVFDNNKKFIDSNDTAKLILPQIAEYRIDYLLPETAKGRDFFYVMIDELIANPETNSVEQFFEKNEKVYLLRTRRLYDDVYSNYQKGFVVELIDDTENQNYLRKIQRMNFDLEVAMEEAEKANIAKSNFLANMSHEIRTPINAVLGLNSIILRDSKEEKTLEYAADIQNSGNALLALINDILDFSKIEAGKMEIVSDKYDVNSLINDCHNMIFVKLQDKNLDFKIESDEKMPSVLYGDEVRIRQICINLLNNAVKYTDEGTVTLKVGYKPLSDTQITFCISVSDTGQGISEENQKHLFESFKRIEEKQNRNIEGTGLGLALVQTLTTLMYGKVEVTSKKGEGSTFSVEIPQTVVDKTPVGPFRKEVKVESAIQKMDDLMDTEGTILVVDDVAMNLKVVTHMLKKSKLVIDTAESGWEAISMVKEKKYDIIFLDHMMPGLDGVETLHQMKAINNNPNAETPVVMLTANAIEGVKEQYLQDGFDDYLSKPVNFDPLKDVIQKYL